MSEPTTIEKPDYIYPTTNTKNVEAVLIDATDTSDERILSVPIEEMHAYAVSGKLKFKVPDKEAGSYALYPISSCSELTIVHDEITGDDVPSFKVGFHNGIDDSDDSYTFTGSKYSKDDTIGIGTRPDPVPRPGTIKKGTMITKEEQNESND